LSAKPAELGERVERLQTEVRDMQKSLAEIKARMAASGAASYVERAETIGSTRLVAAVVHEAGADAVKTLATAIRQKFPSGVIALAGVDGDAVSLLVTASDDAVKAGVHAGNLLKAAAPLVDGKGGGQAVQAQGGGKRPAGAQAALDAIRAALA
jgi:alanyl-tRNA synthetase